MGSSNLPQTITSQTLADQLKDKIKLELVGLIPDDEFHKMIKNVAVKFFETRHEQYQNKPKCSEFTATVLECLKEDVRERTKKYLESDEWQSHWDVETQSQVPGKMISKLCIEHGPEIFTNMLAKFVQNVIQQTSINGY